jgi:hypothetical protein
MPRPRPVTRASSTATSSRPATRATASTGVPLTAGRIPVAGVAGPMAVVAVAAIATVVLVNPGGAALALAYGGTGAYLAYRRPANSLGWWLVVVAGGLALGGVNVTAGMADLRSGNLDPLGAATAWVYGWAWTLVMLGILGITLVYPGGRLPAGRGRRPAQAAIGAVVLLGLLLAIGPTAMVLPAGELSEVAVPNPLELGLDAGVRSMIPPPDTLFSMMSLFPLAGLITMFVRFRRSVGLERLQFRWLVAAVVVVAIGTGAWVIATQVLAVESHGGVALVVLLTYPAIPIAIAIAVLRYRLYEIDRIISRTIGWAVVTGLLVLVFAGLVVGLQALLASFTQGQTLAVAASTLVAFALFQPLRRRVQSIIDRRFDRSRYDGQRISAAFSDRLRTQVDLVTVTADLHATVREAVAPDHMEVWVRRET